jgi:outer membrane protein OmpA-like peptidoglycan-associated protein
MKNFYFFLIIFPLFSLIAQDEEYDYEKALNDMEFKKRYGAFFNANFNSQHTDFTSLPNVPSCCPRYKTGSGNGFNIGGLFENHFDKDFYYGIRLGFQYFKSSFSSLEDESFIIDGKLYPGKIEHLVDLDFSRISLFTYANFKAKDKLFVSVGPDLSVFLDANYKQIEKIKDPSDKGTFSDGLRYRNKNSGNLKDFNAFNVGVKILVGYELILNKNRSLRLTPEVSYSLWLLPLIADKTWSSHNLDLGISIKFIEPPPPPPPPLPPKAPPLVEPNLPEPPPKLVASIKAVEVDTNSNEKQNFSIKIEDFTSLSLRPLLNYVFFDHNSSVIPQRYIKLKPEETKNFSLKKLVNADALETYYHVLNIIGLRLANNPEITINLIGTNSNKGEEKDNKQLSLARAEAVRDYFTNVWQIDPRRITITARNLPKEATESDEEGADDENRRVEIISPSDVLSEPVITGDTIRVVTNTKLRFYPKSQSPVGIQKWSLTIKQYNQVVKEFSGEGNLPEYVEWEINNEDKNFPKIPSNFTYTLKVIDLINQIYETKQQVIPVDQMTVDRKRLERREDREFEYYRLILFDYGSSNLKEEHKKVIDYIKARIKPNSIVKIKGYTDRIGKEGINKRISTQRANAVARILGIRGVEVEGVGESELIYNNDLPEGRFYCRTVTINIETPIKE